MRLRLIGLISIAQYTRPRERVVNKQKRGNGAEKTKKWRQRVMRIVCGPLYVRIRPFEACGRVNQCDWRLLWSVTVLFFEGAVLILNAVSIMWVNLRSEACLRNCASWSVWLGVEMWVSVFAVLEDVLVVWYVCVLIRIFCLTIMVNIINSLVFLYSLFSSRFKLKF